MQERVRGVRELPADESKDNTANAFKEGGGDTIAIHEIVAARHQQGFGDQHTVREGHANGVPLVNEVSNVR